MMEAAIVPEGYSFHSSRRHTPQTLGEAFLAKELKEAVSYKRIAGYFCSSILDVAGPEIEGMASGSIQVVCNARLEFVEESTASLNEAAFEEFMWAEWVKFRDEKLVGNRKACERLRRLQPLISGEAGTPKMEVRILSEAQVGLLHGKAGVIVKKDGSKKSFLGSANESLMGWERNYELVASSDDPSMIAFVEEEFDALWDMARTQPMPRKIIEDMARLGDLKFVAREDLVIASAREETPLAVWVADGAGSESVAPLPALLNSIGEGDLVEPEEYQKWFLNLAFSHHFQYRESFGARFVLADSVGLGKTVQAGLLAKAILLASEDPRPVLVVAPKTLIQQWQEELWEKMGVPSAVWDSVERSWKCEDKLTKTPPLSQKSTKYPACPRRVGLVSAGLLGRKKEEGSFQAWLLAQNYELVIVDEAHRARPHIVYSKPYEEARDNREYYQSVKELSSRTISMILATATPIQMHPVESWYLLNILDNSALPLDKAQPWRGILGSCPSRSPMVGGLKPKASFWRDKQNAIEFIATGKVTASWSGRGADWEIFSNPYPFSRDPGKSTSKLLGPWHAKLRLAKRLDPASPAFSSSFGRKTLLDFYGRPSQPLLSAALDQPCSMLLFTPFVQRIIRRDRDSIKTIESIKVEPFGDGEEDALSHSFKECFDLAKSFCKSLSSRNKVPKGFIETLLLRRLGSSSAAGLKTAERMLLSWSGRGYLQSRGLTGKASDLVEEEEEAQDEIDRKKTVVLEWDQSDWLLQFKQALEEQSKRPEYEDPKLIKLKELLFTGVKESHRFAQPGAPMRPWIDDGCIIFSQYFTTAEYFASAVSNDPRMLDQEIGLYAGSGFSAIFKNGVKLPFVKTADDPDVRSLIKKKAQMGQIKLIFGTDAASEGLNLQMFVNLVNLDLPWNPTRLEQRKGRVQRRGQKSEFVRVFNMRYKDSVEDRVMQYISKRLSGSSIILGQLPDYIENGCIQAALGEMEPGDEGWSRELDTLIAAQNGPDQVKSAMKLYYDETLKEITPWDSKGYIIDGKQKLGFLSLPWKG